MSARSAERERLRAERARKRREELERRWATLTHGEIPAEHREHHHHNRIDGDQCSCGALVSVVCFVPPGPDAQPWECAACGEEWSTYAGPPRHEEGSGLRGWFRVPGVVSGSDGQSRPIGWRDGSTWTEPAVWPWSYPVVDPDTGERGQHVKPGVYRPAFNGGGTVSLYRVPT